MEGPWEPRAWGFMNLGASHLKVHSHFFFNAGSIKKRTKMIHNPFLLWQPTYIKVTCACDEIQPQRKV
jgi:hypothetical protein